MCKIILRYYLYSMVISCMEKTKIVIHIRQRIQINVNLRKKSPRGLALGERNNTVCLQENIIKYSFHLAESLHNFFTNESFFMNKS